MALVNTAHIFVLSCFVLGTSCSHPPANSSVGASNSEPVGKDMRRLEGSSPLRCHLGNVSENTRVLQASDVIGDPEPYIDQRIRLRGYFNLGFEQTALMEPTRRQDAIFLEIGALRPRTGAEVKACHLKLVEVEGVLKRGRKKNLVIVVDAIASPPTESS